MKKLAVALTIIALTSCGGGGSDTPSTNIQNEVGSVTNTDTNLTIIGNNQMQTVNRNQKSSVKITGNSNGVVIKSNISELKIVGDSNTIDITTGVLIDDCNIIGNSNTLVKMSGQSVTCKVVGNSNTGFN